MTIIELKKALYCLQILFGVFLCYLGSQSYMTGDVFQAIASWILSIAGGGLVTFGMLSFILGDDPDIWR